MLCGFDLRGQVSEINKETGQIRKRDILPHETVWMRYEEIFTNNYKTISEEYKDKAVVGKVDVDANQEFAAKYGVRNIPTVLVFQNGEVVGRQVGVAPKSAYTEAIDALL